MTTRRDKTGTRADAAALRRATLAHDLAKEGRALKTERLGRAIANAVIARGAFTEDDMRQAGFTKTEGQELYESALAYAQSIDLAVANAALI